MKSLTIWILSRPNSENDLGTIQILCQNWASIYIRFRLNVLFNQNLIKFEQLWLKDQKDDFNVD